MSDHTGLLKDARKLAEYQGGRGEGLTAATIHSLADALESYASRESEAVAACKTADEAIKDIFASDLPASYNLTTNLAAKNRWCHLDAAQRLCRRAHEAATDAPKANAT